MSGDVNTIYKPKTVSKKQPYFSIVIPALNEAVSLPGLLSDLANQTNDVFEVILVDGNSEDETVNKALEYTKTLPLTIYSVEKRNVGFQRNFGAAKANGQWVIFMDADNRLPTYFLDGVKYQLARHPETDVFTTWVRVNDNETRINQAIEKSINFSFELFKSIGQEAAFGAMIGAQHNVLTKVKFDENQKVFEDALFLQQAVENGFSYQIFREPRYYYSLRRMRKEGTLKMARSTGMLMLKYLQGADFSEEDYGYVMKGGGYYESETASLFGSLNRYVKTASKKQLQHARKLLSTLKELQIS